MKTAYRFTLAAVMLSLISGCALFSKEAKGPEPAPLVAFDPEVEISEVWSARVGDGSGERYLKLAPAIDGARIYAADAAGVVAAFDRNSGARQWRIKLEEPISGGVGAGYGLVLLGTQSGHLLALHQKDGSVAWRAPVSSEILSVPKTNARTVVVQTLDEKIYGFDHQSGEQRWRYEGSAVSLSLRGTSSPVLTLETAFVGMSNGQVVALDADTGALRWKQRVTVPQGRSEFDRMTDVDGNLFLAGETLYATSFQGFAVALEASSGRALWRRPLSSFHGPDEALGNLYVSEASDQIQALNPARNELIWVQDSLANRQISAPLAYANYVAVADAQGYLHLLSQRDGHFVARKKIDADGVRATPLGKGDKLYVYGNSGKLVALTLD